MRRLAWPAFLGASVILLLTIGVTAGTPPSTHPDQQPAPRFRSVSLRQVDLEIRTLMEQQRTGLEALHGRLEAAGDVETSRAIRLEIRALLAGTEIAIMEAQVRHLRREGDEAAASRLEEQIAIMRDPEQRRRALVRPVDRTEEEGVR